MVGDVVLDEGLKAVAAALYKNLLPCRELPHLEVEMRLCRLAARAPTAQPTLLPRGSTKGAIQVGVQEGHFDDIVANLSAGERPLARTVEVTEVVQVGGARYTYRIPDSVDSSPTLVEAVKKSRKFVDDIKCPKLAYDLRLSVSVEDPAPVESGTGDAAKGTGNSSPPPPPPPPRGPVVRGGPYRRRKHRISFVDGSYRYDCTRVEDSRGGRSYEVEVEGVFKDTATELTPAWVEGLIGRVAALARPRPHKTQRSSSADKEEGDSSSNTKDAGEEDRSKRPRTESTPGDPLPRTDL